MTLSRATFSTLLAAGFLFGCAQLEPAAEKPASSEAPKARPAKAPEPEAVDASLLNQPVAPTAATTVSAAELAEAKGGSSATRKIGSTVATLGLLDRDGLWMETPLVDSAADGRVQWKGASAKVKLIPLAGEATSGSNLSLAAMKALGMPLTAIETVDVFVR